MTRPDWEMLVLKAGLDERAKLLASGMTGLQPARPLSEWDAWALEAGRAQARAVLHALRLAGWKEPGV